MAETEQQEKTSKEIESVLLSLQNTAKRCSYQSLDQIPTTQEARTAFRKEFWQRLIIPGETLEKLQTEYCASFYNDLQNIEHLAQRPPSLEKILFFFGTKLEDITDLDDVKCLFVTGEKPKQQIKREQEEEKKRTEVRFKGAPWETKPPWKRIQKDETIPDLKEAKRITDELWQKFDTNPENKDSLVRTLAFGLQMAADFSRQREKRAGSYQTIPAIPIIKLIERLNVLIGQEDPVKLASETFQKEKASLLSQILDTSPDILQKALSGNPEVKEHALKKIKTRSRTITAVLHQDRQWIKEHKSESGGKFLADFLAYFNGELDKLKRNNRQNNTRA